MITSLIRRQLIVFAVVTVVAVTTMGVHYMRLPEEAGIGRYTVSVDLPRASGLYRGAPVTYRGVDVGRVGELELTPTGVEASLNLDSGTPVPGDVRVAVRNGSVIGEPYLDFVRPADSGGQVDPLADGTSLPARRVSLPVSTARMLTTVHRMLRSLPRKDLDRAIREADTALAGNQPVIEALLDDGDSLLQAARRNQASTLDLVDQARPVLTTQRDVAPQVSGTIGDLERLAATLARRDGVLREAVVTVPGATRRATDLVTALQQDLPALLRSSAQLTEVLQVYVPAIRHVLIVMPALVEANASVQRYYPEQDYGEAGLSFKMSVNNPPVCTQGFPEAYHQRSPDDLSPKPLPEDSYCKVPPADPRVVRGTRNFPCPDQSGRRGATAADCGLVFNPRELADR